MKKVGLLTILLFLSCGTGCCSLFPHTIQPCIIVQVDKNLANYKGSAYIVGVQEGYELEKHRNYSADLWFNEGDELRRDDADFLKEIPFEPGSSMSFALHSDDTIWDKWAKRKVRYLVVFSNIPSPRSYVLPLACDRWDGDPSQVTLTIRGAITQVDPPPKSDK